MTMNKKISLYFAMLAMFQVTNCTDKHMDDDAKYEQRSNKYFSYEVIKDTQEAPEGTPHRKSEVISDEKFASLLGADLDRKRITEKVEHGKIITTIEIWKSKRYSASRVGAAAVASGLALGAAGYGTYRNRFSFFTNQQLKDLINSGNISIAENTAASNELYDRERAQEIAASQPTNRTWSEYFSGKPKQVQPSMSRSNNSSSSYDDAGLNSLLV